MDVAAFSDIEQEFKTRVSTIVWCLMTTVDRKDRPRNRIIHPVWEGSTALVLTGPQSFKSKHLARNPHVSLGYWSAEHGLVVADCRAEWESRAAEKARVWDVFKNTPPPYGYDPAMFWKGPDDPGFGVLRCIPWRIELHGLKELMTGQPAKVWRNP